jgi:hypothetical protein
MIDRYHAVTVLPIETKQKSNHGKSKDNFSKLLKTSNSNVEHHNEIARHQVSIRQSSKNRVGNQSVSLNPADVNIETMLDTRDQSSSSEFQTQTTNNDIANLEGMHAQGLSAIAVALGQVESVTANTGSMFDAKAQNHTAIAYSQLGINDVELVASPWHLTANLGMSYRLTMNPSDKNAAELTNVKKYAASSVLANVSTTNGQAFNDRLDDQSVNNQLLFSNQVLESTSRLARTFDSIRAAATATRSAFVLWPQRALHWLADGDGNAAWVRDYQLADAGEVRKLISAIHCLAEQQNFSLSRIMLNGHEVWRAPSNINIHT